MNTFGPIRCPQCRFRGWTRAGLATHVGKMHGAPAPTARDNLSALCDIRFEIPAELVERFCRYHSDHANWGALHDVFELRRFDNATSIRIMDKLLDRCLAMNGYVADPVGEELAGLLAVYSESKKRELAQLIAEREAPSSPNHSVEERMI